MNRWEFEHLGFDSGGQLRHIAGGSAGGAACVRTLQAVVVRWMTRQLERLPWSAERWAREAGLSPTTVTRAMSPTYGSVSSVTTLHQLARAAGVPSILDFLEGQTRMDVTFPVMAAVLRELLPMVGVRLSEEKIELLSQAVVLTVLGMAEQEGESATDPELAAKLARAARVSIKGL